MGERFRCGRIEQKETGTSKNTSREISFRSFRRSDAPARSRPPRFAPSPPCFSTHDHNYFNARTAKPLIINSRPQTTYLYRNFCPPRYNRKYVDEFFRKPYVKARTHVMSCRYCTRIVILWQKKKKLRVIHFFHHGRVRRYIVWFSSWCGRSIVLWMINFSRYENHQSEIRYYLAEEKKNNVAETQRRSPVHAEPFGILSLGQINIIFRWYFIENKSGKKAISKRRDFR